MADSGQNGAPTTVRKINAGNTSLSASLTRFYISEIKAERVIEVSMER